MKNLAFLLLLPLAHAHMPGDAALDTTVEDPLISWALDGEFHEGDEVFVIRLPLSGGLAIPFELLVPHERRYQDWRPAYAVVGPGLPAPTREALARLPRPLPDGFGAYVDLNEHAERLIIFESVLRQMYYSSGPVGLPLGAGETQVWIWSPDGATGPWVLGFGVEEGFGGDA